MSAQFQYLRLKHQAEAVEAIEQVFADVRLIPPASVYANPTFSPHEAADTLRGRTGGVQNRSRNGESHGERDAAQVKKAMLAQCP